MAAGSQWDSNHHDREALPQRVEAGETIVARSQAPKPPNVLGVRLEPRRLTFAIGRNGRAGLAIGHSITQSVGRRQGQLSPQRPRRCFDLCCVLSKPLECASLTAVAARAAGPRRAHRSQPTQDWHGPGVGDHVRRSGDLRRRVSMYVFPTRYGTPYSEQGIHNMQRRALERAGLKDLQFRDLRKAAINEASAWA